MKKFVLSNVPLGESMTFSRPINAQSLSDIDEAQPSNEMTSSVQPSDVQSLNESLASRPSQNNSNPNNAVSQNNSQVKNTSQVKEEGTTKFKIGFLPDIPMAVSSEITIVNTTLKKESGPIVQNFPTQDQKSPIKKGLFKNVALGESGPIDLNNTGQSMNINPYNSMSEPYQTQSKPHVVPVQQPSQKINLASQGINNMNNEIKPTQNEPFPDHFSCINRSESLQGTINKSIIEELDAQQQPQLLQRRSSPQAVDPNLLLSQGVPIENSKFMGHVSAPNIKESSHFSLSRVSFEHSSAKGSQPMPHPAPFALNNFKVQLFLSEDSFYIEAEHHKMAKTFHKKTSFEEVSQQVLPIIHASLNNSQVAKLLKDTVNSNDPKLINIDEDGKLTVFLKTESILGENYVKLFEVQLESKFSSLLHSSHLIISSLIQDGNNSDSQGQLLKAIDSLIHHNAYLEGQLAEMQNRIKVLEDKE